MGNQICLMLSYEEYNYPYRLAHSFVCGDMLTAVIDDKQNICYAWGGDCFQVHTDKAAAFTMLKNLNAWRQKAGKKFLHYGRMVKPMPVAAEGKNSFVLEDGSTLWVEKFTTSAFMNDGEWAQFIVNYNTEALEVTLPERVNVYENGLDEVAREKVHTFHIPPLSAVMIKK
jgi:hypothetical protein